jgi:membrane protease YdiL (CAAX protease family)
VLLMLAPGCGLVVVLPKTLWVSALWLLCAIAGAAIAAFALTQQRASDTRRGFPSFIAAVLIGIAIMAAGALARHHSVGVPLSKAFFLLKQFFLYFPVLFVLEEVAFRGALDSHVYRCRTNGQPSRSAWLSAIFVSTPWGFWHLPTLPTRSAAAVVAAIPAMVIVCTLIGVPLSFCWRSSGTLVLPAIAHALIDSYRNCML